MSEGTSRGALAASVLAGEVRAVARALRVVDDRTAGYGDLLKALWPHTGKAWVVGVTGNPGAGKSTLCDRLIEVLRAGGRKVGVVAVDPSSPYSGGAILGDRIRMARHALDEGVFIRSLATRGHLGGLSRSARDAVRVLDAAGYGVVLVETVGVGQDELEITNTAHTTLVVTAPGLGDEVQAVKAGILECADVFAVNKADREGADAAARDLELMIALGNESIRSLSATRGHRTHTAADADVSRSAGGVGGAADDPGAAKWTPPIVKCVATHGDGVDALAAALERHRSWLQGTASGQARWRDRVAREVREALREALIEAAVEDLGPRLDEIAARVQARSVDPYTAVEELVDTFRRRG
jgi:LAO/AO transport system kinase